MDNCWESIATYLLKNCKSSQKEVELWDSSGLNSIKNIYEELKNLSIHDCKKYLISLEVDISKKENLNELRRSFFVGIVHQMIETKTIHANLTGCTILLEKKVKSFFSERLESGFPTLDKDSGAIPTLIFSGKFLPLKTYHANITGIPRSIFLNLKGWDKISAFKYILFRVKGFSPLLELHLPKLENAKFSADLYYNDCLLTSYVLHRNEHIKGAMQMGWYIDPVLKEISPHLGEVGMLASKFGSLVLCVGSDEAAVSDATMKSTKRRKLYEEGLYQPKRFLRLWSRKDVFKHFPEDDLKHVI